ncbi:MAG: heparinase II/III family protein, partial [Rubripirellula sp.]
MGSGLIGKAVTASEVVRSMGWAWTLRRVQGMIDAKTRRLERHLPNAKSWDEFDIGVDVAALRDRTIWPIDVSEAKQFANSFPDEQLTGQMERLLQGSLQIFGGKERNVGWPPDWHWNVDDETRIPADLHFSRISTFQHGDIKNFWEPARFGFVWLLCRSHFAGLQFDAPRLFFQAIESFVESNLPFRGPHWMCGQEAALRAVTIAAGWSVFGPWATDRDAQNVTRLFAATANRIESHLSYALSQKNNHGLSEALGLLVIGLALPESENAAKWVQLGRKTLERESAALVDANGGFSQQSANYHRVMIHVLTAAVSIAEHHEIEMPNCAAALSRSAMFLHSMIVTDGQQPRYGHDDGACVLDWTSCTYNDFRPALQEACFASKRALPMETGAWDAGLLWLGCSSPAAVARESIQANRKVVHHHAGLAILRRRSEQEHQWFASLRIPPAIYRPIQIDAMHADIWVNGCNIAIDPGTYRYNASGAWATIPLALG